MNWDAIGAIGEVVGAIAVVATIGYLAVQTRQANRLARANAVLSLQSEMREHRGSVVFDSDLTRIILKAEEDTGEELSETDLFKLRVRLESTLSLLESVFLQYEAGVIDAKDLSKFDRLFRHIAGDAKKYGIWNPDAFASGFVSHVDRLLEVEQSDA